MSEIIFVVETSEEGGYIAKALGHPIYTEGEAMDELRENVKDAVKCHFDEKTLPKLRKEKGEVFKDTSEK